MSNNEESPVGQTITRRNLRDAGYYACPRVSRDDVRLIADAIFDEVIEALLRGETVTLPAFGRFNVRSKCERIGRNPKTLEAAMIAPRRVITFKPSPLLVARLNNEE